MDQTLSPTSLAVAGAAMTLSLAAIVAAAARAISRRTLVPYEPREQAPWTAWDVSWVGLYVVLSLLAGATSALVGAEDPPPTPEGLLGMLAFLAVLHAGIIVLALACARLRTRLTPGDLGLDNGKLQADVRLGLAAFLVALAPVYLVQAIVWYGFDVRESHVLLEMVGQHPGLFWPCAVSAVVVAPITEELMFRLLLQGWLERVQVLRRRRSTSAAVASGGSRPGADVTDVAWHPPATGFAPAAGAPASGWNPYRSPEYADSPPAELAAVAAADVRPGWLSLLLPAVLFALVHGWPDCLPLFLFALALGYLYRQTHRIVPCIVLHACLNGGSMFLLWLQLHS